MNDILRIPSLAEVRQDYHVLDDNRALLADGRVIQTEDFPPPGVEKVAVRSAGWPAAAAAALALRRRCRPGWALLLNQVDRHAQLACLVNFLSPGRKRRILLYDVFFQTPSRWKQRLVRWMVWGATAHVVFSRRQVALFAGYFRFPETRVFFIPYKANYSKTPPPGLPPGDYVFAGGNSARDYRTFFEAAAGTGIPCVVSVTAPQVLAGLTPPSNVRVVAAREPEFGRLMAGSRFVVMTLVGGRIRGNGEQTICNAMWQERPIVVADDLSAADYVLEGETGWVLAPGDTAGVRARMLELWRDPARCATMGRRAHAHVAQHFTFELFVRRMRNLALLLGREGALEG